MVFEGFTTYCGSLPPHNILYYIRSRSPLLFFQPSTHPSPPHRTTPYTPSLCKVYHIISAYSKNIYSVRIVRIYNKDARANGYDISSSSKQSPRRPPPPSLLPYYPLRGRGRDSTAKQNMYNAVGISVN